MRGLWLLALSLVAFASSVQAQTPSNIEVELEQPVRTGQAPPENDRLPVGTEVDFQVNSTIRLPAGALCVSTLVVEFSPGRLPHDLAVSLKPSRIHLDFDVISPPILEGAQWKLTTRLTARFTESAAAFEPHRFALTVRVYPVDSISCYVHEATDVRHVEWVPDFRAAFALEELSSPGDAAVRARVQNHANGDARFTAEVGRSGSQWVALNESFRLAPAPSNSGLDTADVRLAAEELPFGFDGRLRFTQRPAHEEAPEGLQFARELTIDTTPFEAVERMHAREEAPGPELAGILLGLALVALRRRGPGRRDVQAFHETRNKHATTRRLHANRLDYRSARDDRD